MKNGPYILVIAPDKYLGKRYRDRYAYQHHVVYWKKFGVIPKNGEIIHHKNNNPHDNRLRNLELMSQKDHKAHHNHVDPVKFKCSHCKKLVLLQPSKYRERIKRNKNGIFCSAKCGALEQHMQSGRRSAHPQGCYP